MSLGSIRKRAEHSFGEHGFKHRTQGVFLPSPSSGVENSVSSSQPIICVPKWTHRVFRRTHRVCPKTQWGSVSSLLRNIRADFWAGDPTKHFSVKKRGFQWKGGRDSVNEGFGKDFYRKGNSVKRSGPFSESPDSENWKVAVQIHFPKNQLLKQYSRNSIPPVSYQCWLKFQKTRGGCNSVISLYQKKPCTEGGGKVWGSVNPRFAAGLPFLVPEILELNSVKVRRGRREGDGTKNVMTERPSHARRFCP